MAVIFIPENLNINTLGGIFEKISQSGRRADHSIEIDLSNLRFIDTCGMTGLANILAGFSKARMNFNFTGINWGNDAIKYMSDSGFLKSITNYSPPPFLQRQNTVVPFLEIRESNHVAFVHSQLKPWIAAEISLSGDALETIGACISEAFQNVEHHAGGVGFGMAQYYPKKKEIHITIADHGIGIPRQVRNIYPDISECYALKTACIRGFTTKKNYKNRGFGLDNLIKYTAGKNGGRVMIRSFGATLVATPSKNRGPILRVTPEKWSYPGTLVQTCLRTDTLEATIEPKLEVFKW